MNLLITGAFAADERETQLLRDSGFSVFFHPDERAPVSEPEKYEAVICNALFLYNPIESFANLKIIQLTSAGKDRTPVDYAEKNGIKIFTAEDTYCIPMAEWAIAGILSIYKNLGFFIKNQSEKIWEKDRSLPELFGKTALICGFGRTGREIAKRLSAFGVKVIAADIFPEKASCADRAVFIDDADSILYEADIVILTLPLCPETRHYMNERRLALMNENAVLVNVARGGLVDEKALVSSLENGSIFGAVLDVFEQEPLPEGSPLWRLGRVIVSPHNSFVGENNHKRLFSVILKNLNGVNR